MYNERSDGYPHTLPYGCGSEHEGGCLPIPQLSQADTQGIFFTEVLTYVHIFDTCITGVKSGKNRVKRGKKG